MSDTAGMNLREPEQIDWENFNPGGKYTPPPAPVDAEGKAIQFKAKLPATLGKNVGVNDRGYRTFEAGPLVLPDGYEIKYFTVSTEKYKDRQGNPINVNPAGKLLRAAGITAKPQTNAQYEQAMQAAAGRFVPVVIEWKAKDRETGFEINGYENFPIDPATGRRSPIVRQGDVLPDGTVVESEVLFANARVRYVAGK